MAMETLNISVHFDHTGSPPVDCDGRSEGQAATQVHTHTQIMGIEHPSTLSTLQ